MPPPSSLPFPLDEPLALYLVSPEGRDLLTTSAHLPGGPPERVLALRKRGVEARVAAGVVEVLDARWRARSRFPEADRLFFTADMLAQATSPVLAAYHAACLAQFATVADLGCGAGIDAIALAQAGIRVTAIDQDPARLIFARANAQACGVAEGQIQFVAGDVTTLDWEAEGVFWDPARRLTEGGGRVSRHAERYEPPLSFLDAVQARVGGGCVKLSPALPDEILEALDGAVAFLSEDRTCKEACFCFGAAVNSSGGGDAPPWSAVLLPDGFVVAGAPQGTPPRAKATVREVGAFVFDPDPAVVRANALGVAAEWLQAGLLTTGDAYLTGDTLPATPQARRVASAYHVIASMPYRPRVVGAWLRERGVGRLVVKKRHFDREPDAVLRELGVKGQSGDEMTLILARDGSSAKEGHRAILCEPERDEFNPSN